ncbi:MAG: type II toxin-antitoxin system VapB family antitoxin [Acidimicrobiia bacterium]
MRTTLIIDEAQIEEAQRLSGIRGKSAVVRAGLDALIAREASRRLAALGGSDPAATAGRRRRVE